MRAAGSCSTARSTTTASSVARSRRAATRSRRGPTPRCCCRRTSRGARSASRACRECSRSPFGTVRAGGCSAPGIGWVSSPSTTAPRQRRSGGELPERWDRLVHGCVPDRQDLAGAAGCGGGLGGPLLHLHVVLGLPRARRAGICRDGGARRRRGTPPGVPVGSGLLADVPPYGLASGHALPVAQLLRPVVRHARGP